MRVCKELLRGRDVRTALEEANGRESEALAQLMATPETLEAAMRFMARRNKAKL